MYIFPRWVGLEQCLPLTDNGKSHDYASRWDTYSAWEDVATFQAKFCKFMKQCVSFPQDCDL